MNLPAPRLAPTARTRLLQVEYLLQAQELLLALPPESDRTACLLALDAHRHAIWEQLQTPPRTLPYSPHPLLKKHRIVPPPTAVELPANLEDLF